eukprot:4149197-Amphidinium_carterae.1
MPVYKKPAAVMKRPSNKKTGSTRPFFIPAKKGLHLMYKRKACTVKKPSVKYTRERATPFIRPRAIPTSLSLADMKDTAQFSATLARMHLIKFRGRKCPYCEHPLKRCHEGNLYLRCNHRTCRARVHVLESHPFFTHGRRSHSLSTQCKLMHCILHKTSSTSMRALLGKVNHKAMTNMRTSLRMHLGKFAEYHQSDLTFNDPGADYMELEADEVTVAKYATRPGHVEWLSYLAIVRRGFPGTLVM